MEQIEICDRCHKQGEGGHNPLTGEYLCWECTRHWNEWRLLPDEQHYRFVDSIEVKFEKENWDKCSWLEPGYRIPLRWNRFQSTEEKGIRIESGYSYYDTIGYVPQGLATKLIPQMEKGVLYSGWVKSKDCRARSMQFDIYERLNIPCDKISKIYWSSGGFFSPTTSVSIFSRRNRFWKLERWFEYKINSFPWDLKRNINYSFCFSKTEWTQFVKPALQICNLMAWADKDAYYNAHVCDGEQWHTKIWQGKKMVKDIFGSNDYPEEWGIFRYFITACLELHKDKSIEYIGHLHRYSLDSILEDNSDVKLAKVLGVPVKDVSDWKKGKAKPDGLTLMRLYAFYDSLLYFS